MFENFKHYYEDLESGKETEGKAELSAKSLANHVIDETIGVALENGVYADDLLWLLEDYIHEYHSSYPLRSLMRTLERYGVSGATEDELKTFYKGE
jgi:hypothetical protein